MRRFPKWVACYSVLAALSCGSETETAGDNPACAAEVATSICLKGCDCRGCSDDERDACATGIAGDREAAQDNGCCGELTEYLTCVDTNGVCDQDVFFASNDDCPISDFTACMQGN